MNKQLDDSLKFQNKHCGSLTNDEVRMLESSFMSVNEMVVDNDEVSGSIVFGSHIARKGIKRARSSEECVVKYNNLKDEIKMDCTADNICFKSNYNQEDKLSNSSKCVNDDDVNIRPEKSEVTKNNSLLNNNNIVLSNEDCILDCETNEGSPKPKRKFEWNSQNMTSNSELYSSDLFFFGSIDDSDPENANIISTRMMGLEDSNTSSKSESLSNVQVELSSKYDRNNCVLDDNKNENSSTNGDQFPESVESSELTSSESEALKTPRNTINDNFLVNKGVESMIEDNNLEEEVMATCHINECTMLEIDSNKERIPNIPNKGDNEITQSIEDYMNPESISSSNKEIILNSAKDINNQQSTQSIDNSVIPKTNDDEILESNVNGENKILLDKSADIIVDETMLENEKNISCMNMDKTFERCSKSFDDGGTGQKNYSSEPISPKHHSGTDLHKNVSSDLNDVKEDDSQSSDELYWLFPPSMKITRDSSDGITENINQKKSHDIIHNEEVVSQNKSCLRLSDESQFIVHPKSNRTDFHDFKNSSFVKDSDNNVEYFYDCDLSSIENSDLEDLFQPLENENNSSLDNSLYDEKSETIITHFSPDDLICHEKSQVQNSNNNSTFTTILENNSYVSAINLESNSCVSATNLDNTLIHPSYGYKYAKEETTGECSKEKLQATSKGLDFEDDSVLPHIAQSLATSSSSRNFKKAFAEKATANTNIKAMGEQALTTYLTQQSMTTSVLRNLHKSLETFPSPEILMDDPKGLVVPLMPHQKHALAWLMWRERHEPKGGILADDMGLGKTLSIISLVLKSAEEKQNSLPVLPTKDTNLVKGGTLIVCPASLLYQWENEVRTKLKPGLLKVGRYHGINRSSSTEYLANHDMITTSYHVIKSDYKKLKKSSPLFKIKWDRIVLDEAHCIRNRKTQASIAVCNMSSCCRWAITGTPIQNKEADFYTLLKFVRCHPFDDWLVWKRWVSNNDENGKHRLALIVKTLMLRRTKQELSECTQFKLPSKEVHTVEIELTKEERNAYEKLLQFSSNLFATYLYEKATKENVLNSNVEVPCKVQYFQDKSDGKEEVFKGHPELLKLFKQFIDIKDLKTYHILVLLLRLRQMCCHPCLIKGAITKEIIKEETGLIEDSRSDTYSDDTGNNLFIKNATSNLTSNSSTALVSDTSNIDNVSIHKSHLPLNEEPTPVDSSIIFEKSWPSSKVKTVCDYVWENVLKNDGKDKAIVVSQWPSMLFLIRQNLLSRFNAKIEMFTGDVPMSKRNNVVLKFNDFDDGPQILLLSMNAGGVGLNLMAANHMFLVDVHWNPQLEAQVCDRIYRVGQTKPVNIHKFVCSNTIEANIIIVQSRKLKIADDLFKGAAGMSSAITIDDLKEIFQMKL